MNTMIDVLRARFEASPAAAAYMDEREDGWHTTTWAEAQQQTADLAAGLLALGVARGDRVAIWGANTLQWALCDLAILRAGAASVGIYPTLTAQEVTYILGKGGCCVLILEKEAYLDAIQPRRDSLTDLRRIVAWGAGMPETLDLAGLAHMGAQYRADHPEALPEREALLTQHDLANLIFTSGTTGHHKGVCLTHGNLVAQISANKTFRDTEDRVLCFLPMAHVAERSCNHYARILRGGCGIFVPDLTRIIEVAGELKPTVFGAVPRVYEKVYEKIHLRLAQASPLRRALFHWAVAVGKVYHNDAPSLTGFLFYPLADALVLRKIRGLFGGRVHGFVCGAAPIAVNILMFFRAAGVLIQEAYGLSECAGVACFNEAENYRFGSVGQPVAGVEVRVTAGEIQLKGPTIFTGYFDEPEQTAEALDGPWLRTGDLGYVDAEGFVWITGRKKNVIITSGGKNVMPTPIEMRLLEHPLVSQVLVHGDGRKYLTAVFALEEEGLAYWAEQHGLNLLDTNHPGEHRAVRTELKAHVAEVNSQLAKYETIKDFRILPEPMTVENGQLTPTMKVKRKVVEDRYKNLLDRMYQS